MKQAKVRRHTVGFFRNDVVPFINLKSLKQSQQPRVFRYWRDDEGKVSQYWHSGVIPKAQVL